LWLVLRINKRFKAYQIDKNKFFLSFLKIDPVNKESFDLIEKAICIICLDKKVDDLNLFGDDDYLKNGNQILNGAGIEFNSANRWFDKTLQVNTSSVNHFFFVVDKNSYR
jgi:hypothetical protein